MHQDAMEKNATTQFTGIPVKNWKSKEKPYHNKMVGLYCELHPLEINEHGKRLYQAFQLDELGEDYTKKRGVHSQFLLGCHISMSENL